MHDDRPMAAHRLVLSLFSLSKNTFRLWNRSVSQLSLMRRRSMTRRFSACVVCLGLFVIGCSGAPTDRPERAPVSGTVVYNGKPIEGAEVAFWAEGAPRPAKGLTDAEGKFALSMFDFNDGAVPGPNKVTVSKVEAAAAPAGDPTAALNDPNALAGQMQQATRAKPPANEIPKKYNSQNSTPITETVTAGEDNTFVIQLTD
jgi:hypothetical protein